MTSREVLILAPNAAEYLPLLEGLHSDGLLISLAGSASDTAEPGNGPGIILGQPDLVAEYLAGGAAVDWVQSTWAGVTPLLELGRRDYRLTGVKDVFGQQVSEYVLAYLLAHELKLLERLGRQANRDWWSEPAGTLAGRTLGIMGTGSIGRYLARMAAPFGVRVLGLSRSGAAVPGFDTVFPAGKLHDFLTSLDYLVCTLPQTAKTERMLDTAALASVRRGCYLVNVGRGSVIDEKALLAALNSGHLGGAALDVFREEPLPQYSPLWHAPDTLVTAHVAAKSRPEDIANIFIENYRRYKSGQNLKHLIDFNKGY
jgi:phosphoglycerate dehydrogenase-like enzyme